MIRADQQKMYRFLVVLTIASTLGLESWLTLFNNFAVEIVALEGIQVGFIQSVREIPGFLAFLVVYLLLIVKEHRLSALAIILLGLGMAITGLLPSISGLIFFARIFSARRLIISGELTLASLLKLSELRVKLAKSGLILPVSAMQSDRFSNDLKARPLVDTPIITF